ncbi:AAA family ATPase [Bacillus sp. FJAT-42315]|uniref:AAA family ATPase n=1 Tax=Bacillus sp. FJAT-42315 TaxID=2014077 RepID=UPI000C236A77|nr:AAA family ATPase [Bacillus sp. FJAT-42315]
MNIKKLIIKNFKNYMGEVVFDLSKEVILLYGANGFGKSSFFDAIEWCLTGKINRFDGSENELKYDIANKRIHNEESFEVAVTLEFDGNTLIRYFNVTNGNVGNLQVRIISKDDKVHIGQEQIENFLKMHTANFITYERGGFSQLLKQAYILSQDQVTDFITSEDAKERYKALANIMGLKSMLLEFDNFKRVLKGLEKNKDNFFEQVSELDKAIINKKETMHYFEREKLDELSSTYGILSSDGNTKKRVENEIVKRLNTKNHLEKYIEFYSEIEDEQKNSNFNELKNLLNDYESREELLLGKKKKAEKLLENLNDKILSLSNLEENLGKVNGLKRELSGLQILLKELNVEESNIDELNKRLELLRSEKLKLEYNLAVVKFQSINIPLIENAKKSSAFIMVKLERISNRLEKNNSVLEKIERSIEENKDQVLAKLISGIRDVQVYTNKYDLNYCPVCSSQNNNLNSDIAQNLNYYLNQLNEESSYYEKIIRLSKYLENRKKKLNEEIRGLKRNQEENETKIKSFENETANYKSSDLFDEVLFSEKQSILEEHLVKNSQEINQRKEAVEIILKTEKISSDILGYEKTSKVTYKIKSAKDLEKSIHKNNSRKYFVNAKCQSIISLLEEIKNNISSVKLIIFNLQSLLNENQYNQRFIEIHDFALESIQKIDFEIDEINLIKNWVVKQEINNTVLKQISNIQKNKNDLNSRVSKLNSYIGLLERYKQEQQSFIGSGISDFLNRSHSTVQRYFRYLDPIPSDCDLVFEGSEEQINIKVAYNKELHDKPGGKSNAKNILSSGQLNVLAISIFLAINKEQQLHSLNFVGIDDPIQNMDDVNQYTMCDVLNNIEKQLIISTHDFNFLKLFIKKNEHRKNDIIIYNLKSPYISSNKLEMIKFDSHRVI